MKKENVEQFFIIWAIVLVLNQIFLFHACFKPYCIGSALPHTAVVAFLWVFFSKKYYGDDAEESDHTEKTTQGQKQSSNQQQTSFTGRAKSQTKANGNKVKRPLHKNWDSNYRHKNTKVQYRKFEFDINGWSTEKVLAPNSGTFEYINIFTGDKYNRAGVDYYGKKKFKAKKQQTNTQQPNRNNYNQYNKQQEEKSFTKKLGDEYEKYIGRKFEDKGDIVIYNGFIKGYEDKGVDIITISQKAKTINLIQCKNWRKKPMILDDVESIFYKLDEYKLDFFNINIEDINKHLVKKQDGKIIQNLFSTIKFDQKSYHIRKVLYASSDRVVDLEIGKYLKMIKPDIFRYEDMKIVIHRQSK